MKLHIYYVYILTNKNNTVLYTGVTNDLARRCYEHKNKLVKGFTEKYNVDKLVYYETINFIDLAIHREKQIKGYSRIKKEALIAKLNPEWQELYDSGKIKKPGIKTNPTDSHNEIPR
jgi:putative endonuclease